MQNLQTKLNLIENHQNIISEEIYNSLHKREGKKMDKDSNNNSTISTKAKPKIDKDNKHHNSPQKPNEVADRKIVKISDIKTSTTATISTTDSNLIQSGTHTLKRKRESKSPLKIESTSEDSNKKQNQTTATILVSKTKLKSGLPLLLKK